ncbi:hypothetical protein DRE_06987 [Drechslerella stenobrocha 248]|uniref:Metallo-beta-lactamase domain-containing protein n=1 Tax=Drechslerella stenobrocha 248 TaxID=1043628 RepID=W7HVT0_9PEZI|nr:hypothetical protein DRE_06987 [Drechslerella stenobrocha 248]
MGRARIPNAFKFCFRGSRRTRAVMATSTGVLVSAKAGLPVPEDAHEKKHHLANGRFANPWPSWRDPDRAKLGVWAAKSILFGTFPKPKEGEVEVIAPQFEQSRTDVKELRATWLGHACFLVEFPGGFRALFDPVFCHRCSPFTFMGPARFTKVPCEIEEIPIVDAVIISHSHYDHLDLTSVQRIHAKFPTAQFFVPLNNKKWFTSIGIENCTEQDWWEDTEITVQVKTNGTGEGETDGETTSTLSATISNLPCQHTAGRTLTDLNSTLWSSWGVKSGGKNVYFAGDTGYRCVSQVPEGEDDYGEKYKDLPHCPAFKQIGDLRGPFDFGMIPIGAYDARRFMSSMHANPFDSVNIFIDINCKKALGMHWGTWTLTAEPILEPPRKLREALKWKNLPEEGLFDVVAIGESRVYPAEA